MQKLSFIIPCYKSENTLSIVVDEIVNVVSTLKKYSYEVILVNDNSPDNTFNLIKELCAKNNNLRGIDLPRNFGQHSAIMAGLNHITGDIIICVDDDGQLPIDELPALIEKITDGYDIVIGEYKNSKGRGFRKFGTLVNDLMAQALISKPKDLHFTSYLVIKRFIVDEMLKYKNPYPYLPGLMIRSSNKVINVPVTHRERINGKSGYTLKKLIGLWMNGFTAFSVKPLRIATIIGIVCALLGFIYGIYTIIHKLLYPNTLAGYSSIMAALLFLGGMIMLMIGLIGEYIGRIYISINNSPQYVIRETINVEKEKRKDND